MIKNSAYLETFNLSNNKNDDTKNYGNIWDLENTEIINNDGDLLGNNNNDNTYKTKNFENVENPANAKKVKKSIEKTKSHSEKKVKLLREMIIPKILLALFFPQSIKERVFSVSDQTENEKFVTGANSLQNENLYKHQNGIFLNFDLLGLWVFNQK